MLVEEDFVYIWCPDFPVDLLDLTCQKWLCLFSPAVALQVLLSLRQ